MLLSGGRCQEQCCACLLEKYSIQRACDGVALVEIDLDRNTGGSIVGLSVRMLRPRARQYDSNAAWQYPRPCLRHRVGGPELTSSRVYECQGILEMSTRTFVLKPFSTSDAPRL